MGEESDPLALHGREAVRLQYVDAEHHGEHGAARRLIEDRRRGKQRLRARSLGGAAPEQREHGQQKAERTMQREEAGGAGHRAQVGRRAPARSSRFGAVGSRRGSTVTEAASRSLPNGSGGAYTDERGSAEWV